jgi:hypothetical protein
MCTLVGGAVTATEGNAEAEAEAEASTLVASDSEAGPTFCAHSTCLSATHIASRRMS